MPGMGMNSGLSQHAWTSQVTQSNVGPVGQYSANGTQPNGAMTISSDGANLLDPGNQGTQVANINPDQTAELTVLNSAYGAEYAKGPVTIQAIGKSGTSAFHGALYLYVSAFKLDTEDSYDKSLGFAKSQSTPSFFYPGGDIGGPLLIPGPPVQSQARQAVLLHRTGRHGSAHVLGYPDFRSYRRDAAR
jgi:uncharacterized membrane protein